MSKRGILLVILGVLALIPRVGRTPMAHRLLIPLFIAFLIWQRRDRLAKLPIRRSYAGLIVLLLGVAMSFVGRRYAPDLFDPLGAVVAAIGLATFVFGGAVMREISFPAAFLLFLVPWESLLLQCYALPMQRFSAAAAADLGIVTGFHPLLKDTLIVLPKFTLIIEPACSGLQSIMAMMAMASLYAYYCRTTLGKRWALFLLGLPLALVMNIVRIWLLIAVGVLFGEQTALPIVHEYSAPILFMMLVFGLQMLKLKFEGPVSAPLQPAPSAA
jgi:exosortase